MSAPRPEGILASRRRARGFTLIELTVALAAGLLVSMALVQVSKEANNTFHEEIRAAAAQMSLRVALERLRQDLQRVAFMSTGNIANDPGIAHLKGIASNTSNVTGSVPGISRLAGIQLVNGGSAAATPLSASQLPLPLSPDSIDLGGNYSSTDEYVAYMCPGPPGGTGGCGGQSICLEWNTPAMLRIRNTGASAAQTLQAYFNPSYASNPTAGPGKTRFMARVTDDSGHYMYVLTCGGSGTTTMTATAASVNLDKNTIVLTSAATGGRGGVGGLGAGRVVISPVELVRWELIAASSVPGAGAGTNRYGATATADPNEYVLVREYVDANTNKVDTDTIEVVSEYAVDLKFAFTVDGQSPTNSPPGAFAPGATPLQYLQLDSAANATWAPDVFTTTPTTPQGPQRIRSVRVRTAIRAATPDRIANVQPVPNTGQPYMYRYLIPGVSGGLQYARVRTGVTEAALPNQATLYW